MKTKFKSKLLLILLVLVMVLALVPVSALTAFAAGGAEWVDFATGGDEVLTLPGQIMVNSDEVYRKTVCGKLPFVEILERIKLNFSTGNTATAVSV